MDKLKLSISPLYVISAFVMVYFGAFDVFCYYFVAMWIHEASHYIVAKRLGYVLNRLDILPYGASLKGNTNYKNRTHEIMVTVAGPISNILVALILISVWWVYPIVYSYTDIFVVANLYIGIFNLLPLFPLDGGQLLLSVMPKNRKRIVYVIMKIFAILVSVVYMTLFVLSAFYQINFSLFLVSLFIFVTAIESYNVDVYDGIQNMNFKLNSVAEEKSYVVDSDTNFLSLTKYFSSNYFVNFLFVDSELCVIGSKNQCEIMKDIQMGKYFLK